MERDAVVRGLMQNPAAPIEVLMRLLTQWPEAAIEGLGDRPTLPSAMQETLAGHESPAVRRALAEHADVDPGIRARLLEDPDRSVRMSAFGRRGQRPLPDDVLVRLMARLCRPPADSLYTVEELMSELFRAMGEGWRGQELAIAHPDRAVRLHMATGLGRYDVFEPLLHDPDPEVAAVAAEALAAYLRPLQPADLPDGHCHRYWHVLQLPMSRALAERVLAADDEAAWPFVVTNPTLPADLVEALSHHADSGIRAWVATRADLTGEQVARLGADPDDLVRRWLMDHAFLTDRQRSLLGRAGAQPSYEEALEWARSENRTLRRRVAQREDLPADLVALLGHDPDVQVRRALARIGHLPPDLVVHLSQDPDEQVRTALARHHPEAPGELLLRCYLDDQGRDWLPSRPRFPLAGLALFADHPDPLARTLAALDPEADPELIGRLLADPDPEVRHAMARCPRLPADRITALLDDEELAEPAAANPALPSIPL